MESLMFFLHFRIAGKRVNCQVYMQSEGIKLNLHWKDGAFGENVFIRRL